ncbi:unnamed protein product, partial [marine sediment metagenome]
QVLEPRHILNVPTIWNGNVTMKVTQHPTPIEIKAYDVSGRMIKQLYTGKINIPVQIQLKSNDFPRGIIFIKLSSKDIIEVRKIINLGK